MNTFLPVLNSFFNDVNDFNNYCISEKYSPMSDIVENDNNYEIILDIPGIDKKNIDINYLEGILTIKGNYEKEKTKKYLYRELKRKDFVKKFKLDEKTVNISKITSSYKNGELILLIPKKIKKENNLLKIPIN